MKAKEVEMVEIRQENQHYIVTLTSYSGEEKEFKSYDKVLYRCFNDFTPEEIAKRILTK
jgi:hypothetical protein